MVTFNLPAEVLHLRCTLVADLLVGQYTLYESLFAQRSPLACGVAANGFTAAVSQLTFGSEPGLGPGDACGRCFALTGAADPYSPSYTGPFNSVVVKVTDMCPLSGNTEWCGQTTADPTNQYGASVQ